jgi:hypothetical protein
MRRIVLVLVLVGALGAAGCGSSRTPTSATTTTAAGTVHLAKTKFVLHAGLAFGAFHRYIYKPIRSGKFASAGRLRKTVILVKAAAAAAFAYHELKLADKDAHASRLLSKLVAPIDALAARVRALGARLRGRQFAAGEVQQVNGEISTVSSESSAAGAVVKDVTPPPSLRPTG